LTDDGREGTLDYKRMIEIDKGIGTVLRDRHLQGNAEAVAELVLDSDAKTCSRRRTDEGVPGVEGSSGPKKVS